jgi:hypothetical protein
MKHLPLAALVCILLAPAFATTGWRSAVPVSSAQASAQKRAGSITGRVISDDGQPLANASVSLRTPGMSQTTPRSSVTDEKGEFRFDDLPAGSYGLSAFKAGYAQVADPNESKPYRVGDTATITLVKGGVITGSVTTASGEPVLAIGVQALKVRDEEGRKLRSSRPSGPSYRMTDDRGVYRIYGLQPGAYLVVANGPAFFTQQASAFEGETPTYFPSSTRDTAAEVVVRSGQEVTGIDIKYRAERGYSISGTVTGAVTSVPNSSAISINLRHAASGALEAWAYIPPIQNSRAFAFHGVANGEYEVVAQWTSETADGAFSSPRRVSVKAADVTGLEIALVPAGSISGRVALEVLPEDGRTGDCKDLSAKLVEEIALAIRRDEKPEGKGQADRPGEFLKATAPDEKGEFTIRALVAGRYRVEGRLAADDLYVRAMALPGPAAAGSNNPARNGIAVKPGESVKGLTVTVSEGAAVVRGRIIPAQEGSSLPGRLRVHLMPAEPEQAENILRFYEVRAQADGTFTAGNLAPGRYRLVAAAIPDEEYNERNFTPAAWDAVKRNSLRLKAEAANSEVELHPCKRVSGYELRYPAPAAAKPARDK